jgi:CBS domain-containing protein
MLRPLAVMMRRTFATITADANLIEAARTMRDTRAGALLVTDGRDYIGIVSEADLVRKAMADGVPPDQTCVRAVMSMPVITIDIEQSAHSASDIMAEKGIRHLAVTEEGRIVGMLSVRDLLRYFKNWGTL